MIKKHAYLIIGHNNFYNLEILIKTLDDVRNDIYIHIDKKVKIFDKNYFYKIVKLAKLYIFQEIEVNWGGFSQIKCELFLLEKAANQSEYIYYHLLSCSDLPIKSQDYIHNFFETNEGYQFVNFDNKRLLNEKVRIMRRVDNFHFIQEYRKRSKNQFFITLLTFLSKVLLGCQILFRISRMKNKKFEIKFGSQWFSITQDFVDYIIQKKDWIFKIFKFTQCPDELFIQILLYNSKFYKKVYYDSSNKEETSNMREISWNYEVSNEHPHVWSIDDYEKLVNSSMLFARKFDEKMDKAIIHKIYNSLNNRRI